MTAMDAVAGVGEVGVKLIAEGSKENLGKTIREKLAGWVVESSGENKAAFGEVIQELSEVSGVMEKILEKMSLDKKEYLVYQSRFAVGLGKMSDEEKSLAAGYFLAALLGMDLENEKDKDKPLVKFLRQATDLAAAQGKNFVTKIKSKVKYGNEAGITEGTTEKRSKLVWAMAKNVAEGQYMPGELPYYMEDHYSGSGGMFREIRRLGQGLTERQADLEMERIKQLQENDDWDRRELEGKLEPGEKRPARLSIFKGGHPIVSDDLLIWHCLSEYGEGIDRSGSFPRGKSYWEKIDGIRGKFGKWLGKSKE